MIRNTATTTLTAAVLIRIQLLILLILSSYYSNNQKNNNNNSSNALLLIPQQTPHSGAHFIHTHPSLQHKNNVKKKRIKNKKNKRFFEGWYYRVTLPEEGDNCSFVFIFSIEDPYSFSCSSNDSNNENKYCGNYGATNLTLSACQVMGPNDEYLVQADRDDTKFWAWKDQQGLGCTFEWESSSGKEMLHDLGALETSVWQDNVKTGFQMLPTSLVGKIDGHDGTAGGVGPNQGVPGECAWDFSITPLCGWGDNDLTNSDKTSSNQKSTAGWLASYPVFEPHWQVTMANAKASGTILWKGKKYSFKDAPFYAEKNWGGAFPISWYWVQCNSFDGFPGQLAVTAGGGRRKLPLLGRSKTEDLGMIGIHLNNTFYEAVPWTGDFEWDVKPWGQWIFKGRCTSGARLFESELVAICNEPGVNLRAPTQYDGLEYFCRDSLLADIELSLYELEYDRSSKIYKRTRCIVDKAKSSHGGVEVGGELWAMGSSEEGWKGKSKMKQPLKAFVKLPYIYDWLKKKIRRS